VSSVPAGLDPQTLSSIADLELVARVTVDGTIAGLHRSPFHGYSAEFSQYRPYRPGDDLKYVDWKLFARTDRFYTKQFRETTNLVAHLALDVSGSMGFAGGNGITKLAYARLLAAAIAHLLLGQGDGVGLVAYDENIRQYIAGRSSRSHLRSVLVALSKLQPSGRTAAALPLKRAAEMLKRRGLICIFSDLYDDDGALDAELRRAIGMGHEVAVFQILTRDELELRLPDEAELEDLESGATLIAQPAAVRAGYARRIEAFLESWRTRCSSYGIDYTLAATDAPLDHALRDYLLRRVRTASR
jgi:uncharacterized protein (DUF58 family)